MWRKQKSLSEHSTLELQNIFLGKCCKYSFKSTSFLQLITTSGLASSDLRSFQLPPRSLQVAAKCRVGSGNTCLVLQGQLCQTQAGTLTARSCTILRATTAVFDLALLHKNNSQQLRVFPEHWGMSSPVPRLVRDTCPHETSAATKPALVSNCSSASTAEPKGFLQ